MAILDVVYASISGNIDTLVATKYRAVSSLVARPLEIGLAINLIVCGYAIMRGVANEPWGAYLTTWFKAYLVVMAATSNFGPWAASAAQSLPDQLVGALGGTAIGGQFDAFIQSTSQAAYAVVASAEDWVFPIGRLVDLVIPDLVAWFLYYLVLIAAYLVSAIALVLALFVKFGIAVTTAVGPIFVGMLMFNSTSGLFFGWLTAIINYAIQSAALALAFVFVTGTVWSFVGQAHANGAGAVAIYGALLFQLTIVLVGGFLLIQASSIASAIAGGGGASGTPLVSAILPSSRTVRAFTSAARSGGGAAIRGAGRAAVPFAKGVSAGLTRIPGASTRR